MKKVDPIIKPLVCKVKSKEKIDDEEDEDDYDQEDEDEENDKFNAIKPGRGKYYHQTRMKNPIENAALEHERFM